jgi:dTDP-4-dehydrorhamnose reductase
MRLLVTGTQGQVAVALAERAASHGITVIRVGRPNLDLADPASVLPALRRSSGDVIVNAAVYTAVDKAESEPALAHRINADGAGAVAAAAAALNVPVVHLSTDYVFAGTGERPYRETDGVGPIDAYGRSKRAGEEAVAAAHADHAVVRTAWVYSPFGQNFARTMLRLGRTRDEVAVVADQYGSPTSALDIADGVIRIARNLVEHPQDTSLRGVFHMVAQGFTNWAGFAAAIFGEAERLGASPVRVRPISTADYPTPARRPANSRLDGTKLADTHGVKLPPWEASLPVVVQRLITDLAH